jgi:hypothetical protein
MDGKGIWRTGQYEGGEFMVSEDPPPPPPTLSDSPWSGNIILRHSLPNVNTCSRRVHNMFPIRVHNPYIYSTQHTSALLIVSPPFGFLNFFSIINKKKGLARSIISLQYLIQRCPSNFNLQTEILNFYLYPNTLLESTPFSGNFNPPKSIDMHYIPVHICEVFFFYFLGDKRLEFGFLTNCYCRQKNVTGIIKLCYKVHFRRSIAGCTQLLKM